MSRRARAAWALIAAFILLCVGWLFVFPERPDRLYRAMPAYAALISDHAALADAWPAALSNATVRQAIAVYGDTSPTELSEDPSISRVLSWVADGHAVLGWAPGLPPSGEPALLGVSHIGGRSMLFRWMLACRWIPGAGRIERTERGTRYLHVDTDFIPGAVLSLAVREGILMAALSRDPDAVRVLENRLLCDARPSPRFGSPTPWTQRDAAPHRFWCDPRLLTTNSLLSSPFNGWISQLDGSGIDLTVHMRRPYGMAALSALPPAPALDAVGDDVPAAVVLAPYAVLVDGLARVVPPLSTWREQAASSDEAAVAYLSGIPYGGRLMGLAIPAITIVAPWQGEPTLAGVSGFLDFLNEHAGLGLIPREAPGRTDRLLVDTTLTSRWGRRSDEECPAVELRGRRLVVSSCAGSLDAQSNSAVTRQAPWRHGLADAYARGGLQAWAWIDPSSVGGETRSLLAVYRLARLFLGGVRHEHIGAALDQAQGVLDVAAAGGAVELSVSDGAGDGLSGDWHALRLQQQQPTALAGALVGAR